MPDKALSISGVGMSFMRVEIKNVNTLNRVVPSASTFYSVSYARADRIAYCLWLCGKSFLLLITGIRKLTAKIVS
jgi:hypothetical protein